MSHRNQAILTLTPRVVLRFENERYSAVFSLGTIWFSKFLNKSFKLLETGHGLELKG